MLKLIDQEYRKYCLSKDGKILKKMRSTGGGGAALAVSGFMLAAIAILLTVVMKDMISAAGMAAFGLIAAGGVIFGILGMRLRNKRINTYLDYFVKKSGYSAEQLEEFEREAAEQSCRYASKKLAKNLWSCLVLTRHWLLMPMGMPVRVEDLAAAFYVEKIISNDNEMRNCIYILTASGSLKGNNALPYNEETANQFIEELKKINPLLIPHRTIQAGGKVYDCIKQPEEVAKLYCVAKGIEE